MIELACFLLSVFRSIFNSNKTSIIMKNTMKKDLSCPLNLQKIFIPFFLALVLLVFAFGITGAQSLPYIPEDNVLLNCGSSGNNTAVDGRSWDGDIDSKFFPLDQSQNNVTKVAESYVQIEDVPYGTARLSRSQFTYIISVTPGPKFIRLHFYAENYTNFLHSKSFFSVKIVKYTLLNNFSASLTANALKVDSIMKEFCVTVEKPTLNITFAPTSLISESFAFINGIEVVSMPKDLYYWEAKDGRNLRYVGLQGIKPLKNNTAFEKMYRINIGGAVISPTDDTGMFRKWDYDLNYRAEVGVSVLPANTRAKLNFSAIPYYAAPSNLYQTALSTTLTSNDITTYKLTWEFLVDSGFDYLVRLHFCDIFPVMNAIRDLPFQLFLANLTAEIGESAGTNVPYFKDYGVSMSGKEMQKQNLFVTLQPIPADSISTYLDTMLSGIEIFKLNDSVGNLAAPNPFPPSTIQFLLTIIVTVVGLLFAGILIFSIIGLLILRQRRKFKNSGTTMWGLISLSKTKSSSLPPDTFRHFTLAQIRAATNNFDSTYLIGVGGFGKVYKGFVDDGATAVAIKRQKPESSQGANEFKTEIEMLSHLRHRHIVSPIGYCDDHREMILIYEYMERGTLSNHLYNTDKPPLSWEQRLQICIGTALGLHYLHFGAKQRIIHRDVKSTNILLDEKWVAKVSDFGLSTANHLSQSHVSTAVKGSIGYLDPEYYKRQQLTEKSDVYSFGVVLCEVLCGRPPVVTNVERRQMSLVEWFRCCYQEGNVDEIVDPHLKGKIAPECLKKYSEIAVNCMLDDGGERPSMKEVAWSLELSLQLQRKSEEPATGIICDDEVPLRCYSWDGTSGAVFSEINHVNAR